MFFSHDHLIHAGQSLLRAVLASDKLADREGHCLTAFSWFSKFRCSYWAVACCITEARPLSSLPLVSHILWCPAPVPGTPWRTKGSISVSPSLFDSIYHGYPVSWGKWPPIAFYDPQGNGSILTHYPLVISVEGVVTKNFIKYLENTGLTKNIFRVGKKQYHYKWVI